MDEITETIIASIENKLIRVWDSTKKVWHLGLYPSCCCETPTETTTLTTETTIETTTLTTETTTLTTETTTLTTETTTFTETTNPTTPTTPTTSETITDPSATSYYYNYVLSSGWIPVGDGTCVFSENPPGNIPIYLTDSDCRCGAYGDC